MLIVSPSLACCVHVRSDVLGILWVFSAVGPRRASVCELLLRVSSVCCTELAAVAKEISVSCVLMDCSGASCVSVVRSAYGVATYAGGQPRRVGFSRIRHRPLGIGAPVPPPRKSQAYVGSCAEPCCPHGPVQTFSLFPAVSSGTRVRSDAV